MTRYKFILPSLLLICTVVFFTLDAELFAQQANPPAPPQDTTAGSAPPAPGPADTVSQTSPVPGLLPETSEINPQVGYNLKITVRMAPVYGDSTLTSGIVAYLPKGSVVGVIAEKDTWYQIAFGPEDQRQSGWVISYGVERTHELEYIVTNREDASRWEGKRVIVIAGETPIRSFPSSGAEILLRAYRNEIFSLSGESEDYYMVQLSNAVKGWVWRGDVEIYVEPKYSRDQVQEMLKTAKDQDKRLAELQGLLAELSSRNQEADKELAILEELNQQAMAKAAASTAGKQRQPLFQLDSLKHRLSLNAGFLRQGFSSDMGLATTMFKGIGLNYRPGPRLSFEVNYLFGDPVVRQPGSEQAALPSSLSGLDTLSVKGTFLLAAARVDIGGLNGVPLLRSMDNYLTAGIGYLKLESAAAGLGASQNLLGALLGWGFGKRLFSSLRFDLGLRAFLATAQVTDVRFSGTGLLQSKDAFLINIGTVIGFNWKF